MRRSKAANITGADGGTYNRNAKSAARSAFESNKQRFFNHLLTAMKCPTLIAAIARDLEKGHACVLQVVSTNEALLDRRLAEIPVFGMGGPFDRHHAAGIRPRLPQALVPDPAVRALQRRRGQSAVAPGLRRRRQSGDFAGGGRTPRPDDRASGVLAAGTGCARPGPAPLRHRSRRGGHRPLSAHRAP